MKKRILLCMLSVSALCVITACGKNTDSANTGDVVETTDEISDVPADETIDGESWGENVQIANPWTDSDAQGVKDATGIGIVAFDEAEEPIYSIMDDGTDKMAQVMFVMEGSEWCLRAQKTAELTDISGMYYDWTVNDKGTVSGKDAVYLGCVDDPDGEEGPEAAFYVQVVNWYDAEAGVTYSLTACGPNLDGMDIQVYAEKAYELAQK